MRARSGEYRSTEPFLIRRTIYVLRPQYFATAAVHRKGRLPVWVKSAVLAVRRSLPVCPDEQTFSESIGMSQTCHQETWRRPPNRPCDCRLSLRGSLGHSRMKVPEEVPFGGAFACSRIFPPH